MPASQLFFWRGGGGELKLNLPGIADLHKPSPALATRARVSVWRRIVTFVKLLFFLELQEQGEEILLPEFVKSGDYIMALTSPTSFLSCFDPW